MTSKVKDEELGLKLGFYLIEFERQSWNKLNYSFSEQELAGEQFRKTEVSII